MSYESTFLDSLYGEISLDDRIAELSRLPLMQRLRHVRLSNIDSIAMPGIANISRYEHSLGTAVLAAKAGFVRHLSSSEEIILQAGALLHDSAIPPYGHLVEEALQYLSVSVSHEARWSVLFDNPDSQPGGVDLQVFLGRQSGLWSWARKAFGESADTSLKEVLRTIQGRGRFGNCVCGSIDLDNLDNVTRAAFHMGIEVDKRLPIRIAEA